jgi:cytochrome c oxidase assembly protein subunit 15
MPADYLSFRKLVIYTVIAVYFLILVGGIVRSTGSGMGCPDWPKCFGSWIPPTNAGQLPVNYKEHYAQKRKLKNERIASYLRILNLETLAVKISGDTSVDEELDFNVLKTWIEYLNRLVGVVIGLLIFAVLISSFKFLSTDSSLFYLSLASFLAVGIEGWLGSIVVSTNLLPFSVTIHMALALVLVGLLIYTAVRSDKNRVAEISDTKLKWITVVTLISIAASFIQILLGTQVRESVDMVSTLMHHENRELWVDQLGNVFETHRTFSLLIFALNAYLIWLVRDALIQKGIIFRSSQVLLWLLVAEIALGIIISNFAIPPFSQPLHLLVGSLILGTQLILFFYMFRQKQLIELI